MLQEFATQGFDLLLKTSQNPKYLEDLTGLSALLSEDQFDDVIECFSDYSEDDWDLLWYIYKKHYWKAVIILVIIYKKL